MSSGDPHLVPVQDAATVVLLRDSDGSEPTGTPGPGLEVLIMLRNLNSDFVGGAYVFPGGAVDPADYPNDGNPNDGAASDGATIVHTAVPEGWELAPRVAAVREAFEEAGLLLARRHHQTETVDLHEAAAAPLIEGIGDDGSTSWRQRIDAGEATIGELCAAEGLVLELDRLLPLSRWTTPLGANRRYDTRFYVTAAPPRQVALHDDVELVATRWIAPSAALAEAAEGTITMIFPTMVTMAWLSRFATVAGALEALAGRDDPTAVTPEIVTEGERLIIVLPDGSRFDAETAQPAD
jgi:8-oxo-dGTP pyrophosphatase MutT (NUDIX family)